MMSPEAVHRSGGACTGLPKAGTPRKRGERPTVQGVQGFQGIFESKLLTGRDGFFFSPPIFSLFTLNTLNRLNRPRGRPVSGVHGSFSYPEHPPATPNICPSSQGFCRATRAHARGALACAGRARPADQSALTDPRERPPHRRRSPHSATWRFRTALVQLVRNRVQARPFQRSLHLVDHVRG